MGSWEEIDDLRKKPEIQPDEFSLQCAQVFSGMAGQRLLEMFRQITIERELPIGASERALGELEAQRQFVRRIEKATVKGLAAIKTTTEKK